MSPYIRKVKTASGATAVQIAEKRGGVRRIVAHVGSAHDEVGLAVLMEVARERLHEGQQELDPGLTEQPQEGARGPGGPVVLATRCEVLWQVLAGVYATLEFDRLKDEAFKAMVLTLAWWTSRAGFRPTPVVSGR